MRVTNVDKNGRVIKLEDIKLTDEMKDFISVVLMNSPKIEQPLQKEELKKESYHVL